VSHRSTKNATDTDGCPPGAGIHFEAGKIACGFAVLSVEDADFETYKAAVLREPKKSDVVDLTVREPAPAAMYTAQARAALESGVAAVTALLAESGPALEAHLSPTLLGTLREASKSEEALLAEAMAESAAAKKLLAPQEAEPSWQERRAARRTKAASLCGPSSRTPGTCSATRSRCS
jgi:hypothetical protein